MPRILSALCFATALLISVQSPAQDDPAAPAINRRQLADCMTRRMSTNRMLSYNEAAKACKNLLKAHKETAANVVSKPVS